MRTGSRWAVAALAGLTSVAAGGRQAHAQQRPAASAGPVDRTVPGDLRPLLTPRRSEMALVVTRYHADRTLLGGNYAGVAASQGQGQRSRAAGTGVVSRE